MNQTDVETVIKLVILYGLLNTKTMNDIIRCNKQLRGCRSFMISTSLIPGKFAYHMSHDQQKLIKKLRCGFIKFEMSLLPFNNLTEFVFGAKFNKVIPYNFFL